MAMQPHEFVTIKEKKDIEGESGSAKTRNGTGMERNGARQVLDLFF